MSKYSIKRYTPEFYDRWNNFIEESSNGTIFHRLDFLSYHKNKFKDNEQHLIWLKGETIFAVMPMAIFEEDGKRIAKSPYGASFGGVVYPMNLKLKQAIQLIQLLLDYLKNEDVNKIILTNTPYPYHRKYTNYIDFALTHLGFQIISRDVFNIVKLSSNFEDNIANFEGRARTRIKKQIEFEIIENSTPEEFFPILFEDKQRHKSKATHNLDELILLNKTFPKQVQFVIAKHKETGFKAGICYFRCTNDTLMTFYMSQENGALGLNGMNVLVYHGIKKATSEGVKYFDFGSSTIGYYIDNIGVADFKEGFGANGYFRDTFKFELI